MVSKLSVVSLALAAASALGDCLLSDNGNTIVAAINTLIADNNGLLAAILGWGGPGYDPDPIRGGTLSLNYATGNLAFYFNYYDAQNTCDATTVIELLDQAAPTIKDIAGNYTSKSGDFASADLTDAAQGYVSTFASGARNVITAAYSWLPCEFVGTTFQTIDGIITAVAAAEQAYGLSPSVAPTKPQTCGGPTPTSPPTCSRRQADKQKRAN
ncbi:hypothetical protein TRVA0_019S02366 [Trichomonascus vanleenenianus]|uniref:uncharacterized protein n=1 Tax=Trichomonascus vanleenenianus TaxID=2268995 RepID=UPI003EC9EBD1